jgi:TRAP-type C4-dicarboxylate transport system substrate-binding protein
MPSSRRGRILVAMPRTSMRRAAAIAAVTCLAVGCSGRKADKSGGQRPSKPVVLTMANYSFKPVELGAFAQAVSQRSHGTIRIAIHDQWRSGQDNRETKIIHDVQARRVAIAAVGTRAWDAVGITSFDALHLPFLIDNYRLEQTVLESTLPETMLERLNQLGLVGLGILPGELRRVVGVRKPLLKASDFRGLTFGTTPARAALATIRLLGGKPVPFLILDSIRRFDGFDFPITSFDGNEYDLQARYITTNLAFWPRPFVIFMNKAAYDQLAPSQRSLLRDAARAAIPGAADYTRGAELQAMKALCLRGHTRFVRASAAELAQLRAAVQPVLASVDPETRRYEHAIEQIKQKLGAPPQEPPSCPPAEPVAGAIPNGTYENTTTAADARRAHIRAGDPFYRHLPTHHRLVIRGTTFTLFDIWPSGHTQVEMEGSYSVYRTKLQFKGTSETLLPISWSFHRKTLRFFDLPFHGTGYYGAEFAPTWTKTS